MGSAGTIVVPATVDITDRALSTVDVVVQAGGTGAGVNSDTVDQQIVSLDPDVIRSPVLGQGGSCPELFRAGRVPVLLQYLQLHEGHRGGAMTPPTTGTNRTEEDTPCR